jgi:hypothetical protein
MGEVARCMDAIATLRQKLNELRPDVVIVVGDISMKI